MSTHEVKVVALPAIEKHPNADSLGLVEINGFTVVVRLADRKEGDLAIYIEPDTAMFAFLEGKRRVKVKKLRGIYSQGLLVPVPNAAATQHPGGLCTPMCEGDNVMDTLGIVRYEPEKHDNKSRVVSGREVVVPEAVRNVPKYDLENLRKHKGVFEDGEPVIATEKIHGANARYTFRDGKMYLGSRTRWVEDDGTNTWSQALANCPWIRGWCEANEGWTLFGEVFGKVQSLTYGRENTVDFRAFDSMSPTGEYVHAESFVKATDDGTSCPVVYEGPFDLAKLLELAEGKSLVPGAEHQIREGIVVKPLRERSHRGVGRVALKLVSNAYLEKHG